ncbi:MurR/RpiR family transcriptional regulator [Homoserinimonas sp. OAct 916]|uniref:MurR/RpiR family transcriptional regulator n=1 Tax=Homoserinimonas sp. OAct 916 TaxID=2211450 RepID=UPI000DBE34E5|nr:MurR/RpiR family transcriptional regulator [Homoserinimonas sp. OAct 916]
MYNVEGTAMLRIEEIVFARMDQLSPAEKKVARSLLADYPSAGLASATALADAAGTSTPTVLRFAARLGYGSYPEFQKQLRDEITLQASSPVSRATQAYVERAEGSHFQRAVSERISLAERLLTSVPPSEFDEAVQLLSNSPRHVVISGGYFTRQIARLLAYQLDQIIQNVDFAEEPLGHDISKYLRLRKDSVAIVFDLRRYELRAKQISGMAKKHGATLIVITDQELSPSAELADVVLPVPVDGIPFDSDVALLTLVECLVEAVFREIGDKALKRMALYEDAIQIHRAFRGTTDQIVP